MISYCRRYWKCFVWAACALAASCGLIWLSRSGTGFAQWYAEYLFPFFPNTIGRLLSPLPFSVYEWVLYALPLGLLCFLAVLVWNLFHCRQKAKKMLSGFFRLLLCAGPAVFLMLTLTCTINYGLDSVEMIPNKKGKCEFDFRKSHSEYLFHYAVGTEFRQ